MWIVLIAARSKQPHTADVPRAGARGMSAITSFNGLIPWLAARAYGTRPLHRAAVWPSAGEPATVQSSAVIADIQQIESEN